MDTTLHHSKGRVEIEEVAGGRRRLVAHQNDPAAFSPARSWVTRYPIPLIEKLLEVKGPAYLCDEIMRDESPEYLEHYFRYEILGYRTASSFARSRVLDFGCGSGASTVVLRRLLEPDAIVGIELVPGFVEIAKARASWYEADRIDFRLSPDSRTLPENLGTFDYVVLSANYEHLLPDERKALLPQIWSTLRPGGVLFVGQTPYRWFPVEGHTTGLPLLNYLPAGLARRYARLSRRVHPEDDWNTLLRKGIRGGSAGMIRRELGTAGGTPRLLDPMSYADRIELWYAMSVAKRPGRAKAVLRGAARALAGIGCEVVPTLSLAIEKSPA